MRDKPEVIKSIQNSDRDILSSIRTMYLDNENFDLDPCYSTGKFYEDLERPKYKYDKTPSSDEVRQCDVKDLWLEQFETPVKSIVFDPPFMFGKHGKTDQNIMTKRFTMFDNWEKLEEMYKSALQSFYNILPKGGYVAFKCQDYTDSKTTLTHCYVWKWALEQGFQVEDLFIMAFKGGRVWNSKLVQRHARKYHSYWFVLKK